MAKDFSWARSARVYGALYERARARRRSGGPEAEQAGAAPAAARTR
jgi:hypothetical protein